MRLLTDLDCCSRIVENGIMSIADWEIARWVIEQTGGPESPCVEHSSMPWSISELLSDSFEDMRSRVTLWLSGLDQGRLSDFDSNSPRSLSSIPGLGYIAPQLNFTRSGCSGLALMLWLCAELRESADFSDNWGRLRLSAWQPHVRKKLFSDSGQPLELAKSAIRAAVREFNLRAHLDAPDTQVWRNTLLLQMGLPLGAWRSQLRSYLDGQPWPRTVDMLINDSELGSDTFRSLISCASNHRAGNMLKPAFESALMSNPWICPRDVEQLATIVAGWPKPDRGLATFVPAFLTSPLLRIEKGSLYFSTQIVDLGLLSMPKGAGSLFINGKPTMSFKVGADGGVPLLSNELRFIPESPMAFVVLEHQGGARSEVCQLWSEDEAVNVFDVATGRNVSRSRWHTINPDRHYCLICREDVMLSQGELQEFSIPTDGWCAYELIPGSWQRGCLEATLDDVLVFSSKGVMLGTESTEYGLECRIELNDQYQCQGKWLPADGIAQLTMEDRLWINAADILNVEIRLRGAPTAVIRAVRLGLSSCQHSIGSDGQSARVVSIPLCDRLGDAGLPLDIAIRPAEGKTQFKRLWLPLLVSGFVMRQEGEAWSNAKRADKRELNVADLRRRQYRCVPEGVVSKDRQVDEGHWALVIGDYIVNSSTTSKPLLLANGFGLALRLVNGPLHAKIDPQTRFEPISSAVIDKGLILEVTMDEDGKSAELLARDIPEMNSEFELVGLHVGDRLALVRGQLVDSEYANGRVCALFEFEKQLDPALAMLVRQGFCLGSHWWPGRFMAAFRPGLSLDEAVLLWWSICSAGAPICHDKIRPAIVESLLAQPAFHLASVALATHLRVWRGNVNGELTQNRIPEVELLWCQALRSLLWKAYEKVGAAADLLTAAQLKDLYSIISTSLGTPRFHEVDPGAVFAFLGMIDAELPKRLLNKPVKSRHNILEVCQWANNEGEYNSPLEAQIVTQLEILADVPYRIWRDFSNLNNSMNGQVDLWNYAVAFDNCSKFRDLILSI